MIGGDGGHRKEVSVIGAVRHHGHWDRYRVFDDRDDAQRAVWRLERQGRDARIKVIHRHR